MTTLKIELAIPLTKEETEADRQNVVSLLHDLLVCVPRERLLHHLAQEPTTSMSPAEFKATTRIYEDAADRLSRAWNMVNISTWPLVKP